MGRARQALPSPRSLLRSPHGKARHDLRRHQSGKRQKNRMSGPGSWTFCPRQSAGFFARRCAENRMSRIMSRQGAPRRLRMRRRLADPLRRRWHSVSADRYLATILLNSRFRWPGSQLVGPIWLDRDHLSIRWEHVEDKHSPQFCESFATNQDSKSARHFLGGDPVGWSGPDGCCPDCWRIGPFCSRVESGPE